MIEKLKFLGNFILVNYRFKYVIKGKSEVNCHNLQTILLSSNWVDTEESYFKRSHESIFLRLDVYQVNSAGSILFISV